MANSSEQKQPNFEIDYNLLITIKYSVTDWAAKIIAKNITDFEP